MFELFEIVLQTAQEKQPAQEMKAYQRPLYVLLVAASLAVVTLGCDCFPPRVDVSFVSAEKVIVGKVLSKADCPPGNPGCKLDLVDGKFYYEVKVEKSYKGCVPLGSVIVAQTFNTDGLCGQFLDVGAIYYLNLGGDNFLTLCNYDVKASDLKASDKEFLSMQSQCCPSCNDGSAPLECSRSLCTNASPPCQEAEVCEVLSCGKCRIRWKTTAGFLACANTEEFFFGGPTESPDMMTGLPEPTDTADVVPTPVELPTDTRFAMH